MKRDVEYWTMFRVGAALTICSTHRTLAAAERAARACERKGAQRHGIVAVKWTTRTLERVRKRKVKP